MVVYIAGLILPSSAPAQDRVLLAGWVSAADTRMPIGSATVLAIEPSSPGKRPQILRTFTDADGRFEINAKPNGEYKICVHSATLYLNPCQWGREVTLTGSSSPEPAEIALERGIRLIVRITDERHVLISDALTGSVPNELPIGVGVTNRATGHVMPVPFSIMNGDTAEFADVVPPGNSWTLVFTGVHCELKDSADRYFASSSGREIGVISDSGFEDSRPVKLHGPREAQRVVSFHVVGR